MLTNFGHALAVCVGSSRSLWQWCLQGADSLWMQCKRGLYHAYYIENNEFVTSLQLKDIFLFYIITLTVRKDACKYEWAHSEFI
jgi:hypothetical protein